MAIIHKIGNTTIDEPIGFDNFKTTIKRDTDYHGISVVSSVGTLEFTGIAAEMITDAYNTDIDTVLQYTVYDTDKDFTLFSGGIDLTTYQQKVGKYCSVSVEIADINIRTEFNNLTKEKVNIMESEDINGNTITPPAPYELYVTPRPITYNNEFICNEHEEYPADDSRTLPNVWSAIIGLPLPVSRADYGNCGTSIYCPTLYDADTISGGAVVKLYEYLQPLYEYETISFTAGTIAQTIEYDITVKFKIIGTPTTGGGSVWNLQLGTATKWVAQDSKTVDGDTEYTFHISGTYSRDDQGVNYKTPLYLTLNSITAGSNVKFQENKFEVTIEKGSYLRMKLNTTTEETYHSKGLLVYNVASQLCKKLGFPAESLIFGSNLYPPLQTVAGDTNYYLASGAMIRGNNDADFTVSFKDLVEALNCISPIGWSIEKENTYYILRIEKWTAFYKDDTILTINNPQEKTRFFDAEKDYTTLRIGYNDFQQASDSPAPAEKEQRWSEITYSRHITSHENQKECICPLIADPFKWELMRRYEYAVTIDPDTNESEGNSHSDDAKLFLFQKTNGNSGYNEKLYPSQIARNFRDYIFRTPQTPFVRSATIIHSEIPNITGADAVPLAHQKCLLKAERLEVKFPITFAQYSAVIANPYGTVVVDGEKCYIQELQYKLKTGEVELKLIPKNE